MFRGGHILARGAVPNCSHSLVRKGVVVMGEVYINNGEKLEEVVVEPRVLRYAKREELAPALRYGRLYRRITDAESGGTYLAGEERVPVYVVSREEPLNLRNFYETVDGIWCPDPGRWPVIFEFFIREGGEALVENELYNMMYPDPAVVLFPES